MQGFSKLKHPKTNEQANKQKAKGKKQTKTKHTHKNPYQKTTTTLAHPSLKLPLKREGKKFKGHSILKRNLLSILN